jgi:adenylosuccinate lyase
VIWKITGRLWQRHCRHIKREGYHKPYEALLDLTRTNQKITRESILGFIENLDVSETLKSELKGITPFNFTGF